MAVKKQFVKSEFSITNEYPTQPASRIFGAINTALVYNAKLNLGGGWIIIRIGINRGLTPLPDINRIFHIGEGLLYVIVVDIRYLRETMALA